MLVDYNRHPLTLDPIHRVVPGLDLATVAVAYAGGLAGAAWSSGRRAGPDRRDGWVQLGDSALYARSGGSDRRRCSTTYCCRRGAWLRRTSASTTRFRTRWRWLGLSRRLWSSSRPGWTRYYGQPCRASYCRRRRRRSALSRGWGCCSGRSELSGPVVQAEELLAEWLAGRPVALCEASEGEGQLWVVLRGCVLGHARSERLPRRSGPGAGPVAPGTWLLGWRCLWPRHRGRTRWCRRRTGRASPAAVPRASRRPGSRASACRPAG